MIDKKDRHNKNNLLIQFRSSASIGTRIANVARRWGVTPNEAGRRLAVLALLGLTQDEYELIRQLEEGPGVDDFSGACGQVLVASDVYEQMTVKPDCPPPSREDRFIFLLNWAKKFVASHAPQDEPVAVPTARSGAMGTKDSTVPTRAG